VAFLSNFLKPKITSVIGVDVGSSSIKIVQIHKKNGQAVLETYGELALGPYADSAVGQAVILPAEKISEALLDLMREKEVNITTNHCGVSIPFSSSLMSVIELPHVSEKQLALMVPLEARKYIPVPISEVMLDWSLIPKTDSKEQKEDTERSKDMPALLPKVDVLVVAIHNDTMNRYQNIVKNAGLEAGFYEIEIFSTMRSVVTDSLKPIMIMDMGAATTKLYIIERGVVKASHTINRGAQDITSNISKSLGIDMNKAEILKRQVGATGEDKTVYDVTLLILDHIFAEANQALLAFEKKYNETVSKVIIVGGGAALKGINELAKTNFKTEAVMGNPFEKISTPAFLEEVLAQTGPEFAVAIGLALRRLSEEG
jgi:type IV pilus assembly protein PilM